MAEQILTKLKALSIAWHERIDELKAERKAPQIVRELEDRVDEIDALIAEVELRGVV
ncbi:MAG: hypothetical protein ABSG63_07140 [Spirochaetia bacterium]|jgi:nitrate/nitrite-specific signal transduction histidine kinase